LAKGRSVPLQIDVHLDYAVYQPSSILLQLEVAEMADQRQTYQNLSILAGRTAMADGHESIGRRCWAQCDTQLIVDYNSVVEFERTVCDVSTLAIDDPFNTPGLVIPYLMPSRYCESDEFESFVAREFGSVSGGAKVQAMVEWIGQHVDYVIGASNGDTTAVHTFVKRAGVCRDFAHLLASFCRAAMIPARLVSAYAPDVMPPDFHAVVEVWLEGGWHLIDPTGMAKPSEIARICVGRDATDIAFMTVFGQAGLMAQTVSVTRIA
jgi:transglutaminase-like putative cysteine protease